MAEKFRASMVRVSRVYEVICEAPECNGNYDSEFYDDRADAVESRRVHIEQHHRDEQLYRQAKSRG